MPPVAFGTARRFSVGRSRTRRRPPVRLRAAVSSHSPSECRAPAAGSPKGRLFGGVGFARASLTSAVRCQSKEVYDFLEQRGADPKNSEGVLAEAARLESTEWVKRLLAEGVPADGAAVRAAVSHGRLEAAQLLLEAKAPLTEPDSSGGTALMLAAANGSAKGARWLLDHLSADARKAALDAQDREGQNALMCAVDAGATEVIQLLAAAGANVALRDKKGETAVERARAAGRPELAALVPAGAAKAADQDAVTVV